MAAPLLDIKRAGTATYRDSTGKTRTAQANEARFDHTSSGKYRGLMLYAERATFNPKRFYTTPYSVRLEVLAPDHDGVPHVVLSNSEKLIVFYQDGKFYYHAGPGVEVSIFCDKAGAYSVGAEALLEVEVSQGPSVDLFAVGHDVSTGTLSWNGHVKKAVFYPFVIGKTLEEEVARNITYGHFSFSNKKKFKTSDNQQLIASETALWPNS